MSTPVERDPVALPTELSPGVTREAAQQQLERILNSRRFAACPRLSTLLRFCVDKALAGEDDQIKEYLLGVQVFGRSETFDPRMESIVRVEARRLRAKLDAYYQDEGREDPVQIAFHRGDYRPRFTQARPFAASGELPARLPAQTRVLVVEDEMITARDLTKRLTDLGYQAGDIARTAEDAIRQVEQSRPDIVLMDIILAGERTGIDAARTIWERSATPVIYVTAYSDPSTLAHVRQAPSYGFLIKPFQPQDLNVAIQLALARRDAERAQDGTSSLAEKRREALQTVQTRLQQLRHQVLGKLDESEQELLAEAEEATLLLSTLAESVTSAR